jgi:hypothetical protein
MTNTQQRVLRAIKESPCLVVGGEAFVRQRTTYGIHDDPDDLAVEIQWEDETGCRWEAQFTEQSLAQAKIEGNDMRMLDLLGTEVVLTALRFEPAFV